MSGEDIDLDEMLGPDPVAELPENLVTEQPPGYRPMGAAGRALLERSRRFPMPGKAKKNTPERLKRILRYATEMPVDADVCRRAEISLTTLKYWLQKSLEGGPGDGFDIELGENDETDDPNGTIRFHLAYISAMREGVEAVEAVGHMRASGYQEPQVYRGRVQYKLNQETINTYNELGLPVDPSDANLWLRDEAGAPIAETVTKIDPDLLMFILKARKADVYGPRSTMDVNVRGGVLVVPMRVGATDLNEMESQYRKQGGARVTFEESDDPDV